MSKYKKRGWFKEPYRHSLAAQGIKTNYMASKNKIRYFQEKDDKDDEEIGDDGPGDPVFRPEDLQQEDITAEGLAGIAPDSPSTAERRLGRARRTREKAEELIRQRDPLNQLIERTRAGNISGAENALRIGQVDGEALDDQEREAIQSALSEAAVQRASAGIDVDEDIKDLLTGTQKSLVEQVEREAEREAGLTSRQLKDLAQEQLVGAADVTQQGVERAGEGAVEAGEAGLEGVGDVFRAGAEEAKKEGDFPGIIGGINELEQSEMNEANVFTEDDSGGMKGFGIDEVPKLSDNFDFAGPGGNIALEGDSNVAFGGKNPAMGGGNPALGTMGTDEEQPTFADKVTGQINSFYNNRFDMSEVDVSPYERGKEAFQKGNREELIDAISNLQAEEAKIQDRWNMVSRTHASMQDNRNWQSAFDENKNQDFFDVTDIFNKGGADQLEEQTEKLSEVKGGLIKANNKVQTRRKMLEFDLQRMDAAVEPETSVPDKVDRFEPKSNNFGLKDFISNASNPLLGGGNN